MSGICEPHVNWLLKAHGIWTVTSLGLDYLHSDGVERSQSKEEHTTPSSQNANGCACIIYTFPINIHGRKCIWKMCVLFTPCSWLKFIHFRSERLNVYHARTTILWLKMTLREGEQGGCAFWVRAARDGRKWVIWGFHTFSSHNWWCRK